MKRTLFFTALIFSMFFTRLSAQDDNPVIREYKEGWDAEKGYIVTQNDEYKQGYVLISKDMNNSEYVDFLRFIKAQPERFTIENIKEYGYNDVVYVTVPYNGKIVFMRKMNLKEPSVYYYKSKGVKEFYIIKDGDLILLPTENVELRDFLANELECEYSKQNSKLAIYNKTRLKYIFDRNSSCENKRIPFFSYGINISYGVNTLKLDPAKIIYFYNGSSFIATEIGELDNQFHSSFSGSVFADIPLSTHDGKVSFHPEIQYRKSSYDLKRNSNSVLGFDVSYLSANILARYKTLEPKQSLYIDFGLSYSIINGSNYYILSNNTEQNLSPFLENAAYGVVAGVGFSFPFAVRNTMEPSLRYTFLFAPGKLPSMSSLDLVVGLGF